MIVNPYLLEALVRERRADIVATASPLRWAHAKRRLVAAKRRLPAVGIARPGGPRAATLSFRTTSPRHLRLVINRAEKNDQK